MARKVKIKVRPYGVGRVVGVLIDAKHRSRVAATRPFPGDKPIAAFFAAEELHAAARGYEVVS